MDRKTRGSSCSGGRSWPYRWRWLHGADRSCTTVIGGLISGPDCQELPNPPGLCTGLQWNSRGNRAVESQTRQPAAKSAQVWKVKSVLQCFCSKCDRCQVLLLFLASYVHSPPHFKVTETLTRSVTVPLCHLETGERAQSIRAGTMWRQVQENMICLEHLQTSPTAENNPVQVHSLACIHTTFRPPEQGRLFHAASEEEPVGRAVSLTTAGHHLRWQRTGWGRREGSELHRRDGCRAVLEAVPGPCWAHGAQTQLYSPWGRAICPLLCTNRGKDARDLGSLFCTAISAPPGM